MYEQTKHTHFVMRSQEVPSLPPHKPPISEGKNTEKNSQIHMACRPAESKISYKQLNPAR